MLKMRLFISVSEYIIITRERHFKTRLSEANDVKVIEVKYNGHANWPRKIFSEF